MSPCASVVGKEVVSLAMPTLGDRQKILFNTNKRSDEKRLFFLLVASMIQAFSWYNWVEYSRTCVKQSPCFKQLVVRVPNFFLLSHCNFHLCKAITSIRRSRTPFTKSLRPLCLCVTKAKPLKKKNNNNLKKTT